MDEVDTAALAAIAAAVAEVTGADAESAAAQAARLAAASVPVMYAALCVNAAGRQDDQDALLRAVAAATGR